MSDPKSDVSELLADAIAREDTLRSYISESNQARYKLQREVEEQEQEIADLNRELEITRKQRDNAFAGAGYPPRGSAWSAIGNWIKRLAK